MSNYFSFPLSGVRLSARLSLRAQARDNVDFGAAVAAASDPATVTGGKGVDTGARAAVAAAAA